MIRTVAENKLANTGNVHGDAAEEVVRAADSGERYSLRVSRQLLSLVIVTI